MTHPTVIKLHDGNLMPQLMAWGKTREAKQGKHLLLPVDDPVLVDDMEQNRSGGLALVAPIYRNHQRAGVMQTPSGFVMAILPWRQMAQLLEPYLKGSPEQGLSADDMKGLQTKLQQRGHCWRDLRRLCICKRPGRHRVAIGSGYRVYK